MQQSRSDEVLEDQKSGSRSAPFATGRGERSESRIAGPAVVCQELGTHEESRETCERHDVPVFDVKVLRRLDLDAGLGEEVLDRTTCLMHQLALQLSPKAVDQVPVALKP